MDDIRLVFIGSATRAIGYARDHLPEPSPRPDQILAVQEPGDAAHLDLPPWCHIGTELLSTRNPPATYFALEGAPVIFEAVLARRRRLPKAGV